MALGGKPVSARRTDGRAGWLLPVWSSEIDMLYVRAAVFKERMQIFLDYTYITSYITPPTPDPPTPDASSSARVQMTMGVFRNSRERRGTFTL